MVYLGSDPEFFIYRRTKRNGKKLQLITADKVLNGKDNMENCGLGKGLCFFDGVQAEINPMHNRCREVLARNIQVCLKHVYNKANKKYKGSEIYFLPVGCIDIEERHIKNADDECKRFGCSPDDNIYSREPMDYPDGETYMKRFSGGHIHIGFKSHSDYKTMFNTKRIKNLIYLLDLIPGTMSVCMSNGEEEAERRQYYGKAGTYRLQTHGLEYRSLSSFWMVSPQIYSLVFGLVRDAFTIACNENSSKALLSKVDMKKVSEWINTSNIEECKKIYTNILKPWYASHGISNSPFKRNNLDTLDNIIENGYRYYFKPKCMLNYWGVKSPKLYKSKDELDVGWYGFDRFNNEIGTFSTSLKKIHEKVK